MPIGALLARLEIVLLLPIEVGLLAHLVAVLARRNADRTDVDAIGLGALEKG